MDKMKMNSTNDDVFNELLLKLHKATIDKTYVDYHKPLQKMLELIGQYFEVSRIHIYTYDVTQDVVDVTTEWYQKNLISQKDMMQHIPLDIFKSGVFEHHQQGEAFLINNISEVENESMLHAFFRTQGAKSIYTLPLRFREHTYGFIDYQHHQSKKTFIKNHLDKLNIVTHMIESLINPYMFINTAHQDHESLLMRQRFLSNLSHELKTPLGGMLNTFSLLEASTLSQEQKNYLDMGRQSLDAITKFVEELLELSQLEAGIMKINVEPFDLEEEVIRSFKKIKNLGMTKALTFNLVMDYHIPIIVMGDQKKIRHIIQSLLLNSLKQTQKGHIECEVRVATQHPLNIEFTIHDTSEAISHHEIDYLFDLFQQARKHPSEQHLMQSLSLPITKKLIEHMGGSLTTKQHKDSGIIYQVILPMEISDTDDYKPLKQTLLVALEHKQHSKVAPMFKSLGLKIYDLTTIGQQKVDYILCETPLHIEDITSIKKIYAHHETQLISCHKIKQSKAITFDYYMELPISRSTLYHYLTRKNVSQKQAVQNIYHTVLSGHVLIVDDNRLNRIALENILGKFGMKSTSVESGQKAIEYVKKMAFDMILMDIQMPGMDGVEATRRIRALGKIYEKIPIVAVTANAFFKDYDLMKHAQINDVIFKPIKVDNLNLMLRKYIETGAQIQVPNDLFSFDEKDFKQRFEGSDDIASEVLSYFLETYQNDLDHIKDAVKNKQTKQIIETTHYFKGSCGYLSAIRSVWVLNQMMDLAKQNTLDHIDIYFEMLEHEIKDLVKHLKEYSK